MNGSLKVFDLNEGRLARNLGSHPVNVTSLQYHPYGEFIVSGSVDCTMKVWDVRNKSCIQTYNGHTKEVTCVRFSPDGKWVASSSKDGQILLWDLVAGKLINSIKLAPTYVRTFEFNPVEFTLAAATSMRTVRLWDLDTMEPTGSTNPESTQIQAITYNNSGNRLCTAAKDTLKCWDLDSVSAAAAAGGGGGGSGNSGAPVRLLSAQEAGWDKIEDMKISNNSRLIAGSCVSNFVSVWSVDLSELEEDDENERLQDNNNIVAVGSNKSNGNVNKRDSKSIDNSPAGGRAGNNYSNQSQQQQQLNDVRRQLSQLNDDASFDPQYQKQLPPRSQQQQQADIAAQDKVTAGLRLEKPQREVFTVGRSNSNVSNISSNGGSNNPTPVVNPATGYNAAAGASGAGASAKYTDDKEYAQYKPYSGAAGAADAKRALDDVPMVVWNSGNEDSTDNEGGDSCGGGGRACSAQEMATSMGESFWKRFKETSQQQHRAVANMAADQRQQPQQQPKAMQQQPKQMHQQSKALDNEEDEEIEEEDEDWEDDQIGGDQDEDEIDALERHMARQAAVKEVLEVPNDELEDMLPRGNNYNNYNNNNNNYGNNNVAAVRKAAEDRRSVGNRAVVGGAAAPIVRSSPALYDDCAFPPSAPAGVAGAAGAAANYPRKGATPQFPRPVGRLSTPVSAAAVNPRNNSNNDEVEQPIAVVGVRHQQPPMTAGGAGGGGGDSEHKRVSDLLEQLITNSGPAMSALSQRLASLRVLRQLWARGEVAEVVEHLTILSEAIPHSGGNNLTTLADFFMAVELRGNGLSLDACVRLLPVLESMVSTTEGWRSEHVMYAAFRSFVSLADAFGELIRSTRALIVVGGVDLSREARLNKCNACHAVFYRVGNRLEQLKRQFRASRTIFDVLDAFQHQCSKFFSC